MKKFILIAGGIGVLLIVLVIASSGSKSNNSQSGDNKQGAASPTPATAMKVTAKEIADDFDDNQVAAESKWKDKLVEFSAKISNITDTGLSFSSIGSKQFSVTQISCRIQDKQQLLPLKNGQTVTVRGVISDQTIGVIDMSKCEVVN